MDDKSSVSQAIEILQKIYFKITESSFTARDGGIQLTFAVCFCARRHRVQLAKPGLREVVIRG